MTTPVHESIEALSARRFRVAVALTVVMMVAYFGFILLIAFDKPLMGTLLANGGLSVGVLLGALVIVLAPLLTGIYVRWANVHYDHAVTTLQKHREQNT